MFLLTTRLHCQPSTSVWLIETDNVNDAKSNFLLVVVKSPKRIYFATFIPNDEDRSVEFFRQRTAVRRISAPLTDSDCNAPRSRRFECENSKFINRFQPVLIISVPAKLLIRRTIPFLGRNSDESISQSAAPRLFLDLEQVQARGFDFEVEQRPPKQTGTSHRSKGPICFQIFVSQTAKEGRTPLKKKIAAEMKLVRRNSIVLRQAERFFPPFGQLSNARDLPAGKQFSPQFARHLPRSRLDDQEKASRRRWLSCE